MDNRQLELYTDYLISNCGYATALSAMVNGECLIWRLRIGFFGR